MKRSVWFRLCLFMAISAQLYADELTLDEKALKSRAYKFMTEGWGGEAIHGYEATHDIKGFFHQIGKVSNEDIRLIKHKDNPSENDELHNYQYDGMSISVYLARFANKEKVMVDDVVITSPNWPVKYDLIVGMTRKQVEDTLGKSMENNSATEWIYKDGAAQIIYSFDKNDKVMAIKWHSMID